MAEQGLERVRGSGIVHGSPAGYLEGCRQAAGCPHHHSPTYLTCSEAIVRRRGDYGAARLPLDQPLPRFSHPDGAEDVRHGEGRQPVHGTVWGYRRGCRRDELCPNWGLGRTTCCAARREYYADYHGRRLAGLGTPITHGTSAGYLAGCRTQAGCPRGGDGLSCADARAAYRRRAARDRGVGPPPATVPAAHVVDIVADLRRWGMSLRSIARATGVGRSTIARILHEPAEARIRVETADRLEGLAATVLPNTSAVN